MSKTDKKRIEEISKVLLKASALDASTTDRIADRPELFAGVLRRIKENEHAARPVSRASGWMNWRTLMPAGSIALVMVAVTSAILVKYQSNGAEKNNLAANAPAVLQMRPAERTAPQTASPSPALPSDPIEHEHVQRQPDRKTQPVRTAAQPHMAASRPVKRNENANIDDQGAFYPLTYAGDPYETARGGRIVRVDMPRASLFAMGIDVPLENETVSVKADLLIGPDGVARGFRLVR